MDFNFAIDLQTASATYLNINSVTASSVGAAPVSGYKVEQVNLAQSNVNGFLDQLAQRDGLDSAEAFLGARQVQLIVSVYGSSLSDFWDKVDAVSGAMAPYPSAFSSDDGFRKLRFVSPYSGGSRTLYLNVRPQALPGYTVDRQTSVGDSVRGFAQRMTLVFIAKDPRKLNDTASTGSISIGSTTASSITTTTTITNNGNYIAYPIFTVSENVSGTGDITISTNLWTTKISSNLGALSFVLDSEKRTVRNIADGALKMNTVLNGTTAFPSLQPGSNVVTITTTHTGGDLTISYSFREAWL